MTGARLPRPRAGGGGPRADPVVRHRRAVRRQVLLPRRARGPAAAARRLLPGRDRGLLLGRPAGARQDHRRGRVPRAARDRPGAVPARGHRRRTSTPATSSQIDLNRPMAEIRAELSKYPVKTRLSLTGPLVVARDIAHAKIKERLDAGEAMPQYLKDHAGLLRRPGQDPRGLRVRLVRPDHGRPDGLLRRAVPGRRRLAW